MLPATPHGRKHHTRRSTESWDLLPGSGESALRYGCQGTTCSQLQPRLGQWSPGVRQRTRGGFWDFQALTLGQGYHC